MDIMIYGREDDEIIREKMKKTEGIREKLGIKIAAYLDIEIDMNERICKLSVYLKKEITLQQFLEKEDSKIIICDDNIDQVKYYLTEIHKISPDKIEDWWFFIKLAMMEKYKDSPDTEIQETLKYWKMNSLSVFNQFISNADILYSEVKYDERENLPYIVFFEKRMYFPENYPYFISYGGKIYLKDILYEQKKGSPHMYLNDRIQVKEGDVIVDAGVCEGNFALQYVEQASKIYLIECDEQWIRPLKLSFREYKDKVVICNKKLGAVDDDTSIRLDTLIEGKIDFLKMDIEGAELDALDGAEEVLKRSQAKCAICAYHKSGDEEEIRKRFVKYGYKTETSSGYMVFIYDSFIYEKLDFRRGIVYAYRKDQNEKA